MVLTDGWYSLRTVVDAPLSQLVDSGKIDIGTKLCVVGSELVGPQEACSPLEVCLLHKLIDVLSVGSISPIDNATNSQYSSSQY